MPLGEWTRRLEALPAEAYDCFMVETPCGFNRIQAWFARLLAANSEAPLDHRAADHPITGSLPPCSRPSEGQAFGGGAKEAPSLTAAARDGDGNVRSGGEDARGAGRTKEWSNNADKKWRDAPLTKKAPYKPDAEICMSGFGFGLTPKIVIAALIAFFPIVINTAKGLSSVEAELLQYMDTLGAKTSEKFFKISLPWALPYIFAAFKISITLAIVGAVVGEFVAAGEGLGYVINAANIALDTELMFAGIVVLSVLGIVMFLAVVLVEQIVTGDWQQGENGLQATM